jgi:Raf kinase inhibitor-like YbhB/YbcL family protein
MALKLTSPSFEHGGTIPRQFTCDGKDTSPPLEWSGAPSGTQGFALIVDDPDAPDPAAPKRTWVHWVVYNLPADARALPEGAGGGDLSGQAREGKNDWDRKGYGGPCPPKGRHRYFFKLYALDRLLEGLNAPTKADVERAMRGHILDQTELIGTYERSR